MRLGRHIKVLLKDDRVSVAELLLVICNLGPPIQGVHH
jgi:hypothetical protein